MIFTRINNNNRDRFVQDLCSILLDAYNSTCRYSRSNVTTALYIVADVGCHDLADS